MNTQRLPAEWEPQDAIFLAWPHKGTDWNLSEVLPLYEALVSLICDYADVVVAIANDDIEPVRARLEAMDIPLEYVYFYPVETTSTWTRYYGPLCVQTENGMKLLDFTFNASSLSRLPELDNQISKKLYALNAFPSADFETLEFVLEGSAIETDGQGTLLINSASLLTKNHNQNPSNTEVDTQLKQLLGAQKIYWLHSGYLAGDNAEGHIDKLVRFCPNNTIVYTACDDDRDEHYVELKKMERELVSMTNSEGVPYRLLPLPWPGEIYGNQDQRLPGSYASFLIVNEAVLVPTYDALSDEDALEVIAQAFPGYEIFGIPSLSLIEQRGSLHAITMQLPEGVLFSC